MYVLEHSAFYDSQVARFLKLHPDMRKRYEKTLSLLELDPGYPALRLHKLSSGKYSVSINKAYNKAYRILIDFKIEGNRIILLNIGTHREVYGKG